MAIKRGTQVQHIDELTSERHRVTSASSVKTQKSTEHLPRNSKANALIVMLAFFLAHISWKLWVLEGRVSLLRPDGIGLKDFAFRYNGARIVPSLTSQIQPAGTDDSPVNTPYMALDDDLRPGRCWPFTGRSGQLGVLFPVPLKVTQFTVDHISKDVALHLGNAPRRIVVWGLTSPSAREIPFDAPSLLPERERPAIHDPNLNFLYLPLLDIEYDAYSSRNTQTFKVAAVSLSGVAFNGAVVEVLSNWGSTTTCVYRIRVHGTPVQ